MGGNLGEVSMRCAAVIPLPACCLYMVQLLHGLTAGASCRPLQQTCRDSGSRRTLLSSQRAWVLKHRIQPWAHRWYLRSNLRSERSALFAKLGAQGRNVLRSVHVISTKSAATEHHTLLINCSALFANSEALGRDVLRSPQGRPPVRESVPVSVMHRLSDHSALFANLEALGRGVLRSVRSIAIDGTSSTALLVDRQGSGALLAAPKLYNEGQPQAAVDAVSVSLLLAITAQQSKPSDIQFLDTAMAGSAAGGAQAVQQRQAQAAVDALMQGSRWLTTQHTLHSQEAFEMTYQ